MTVRVKLFAAARDIAGSDQVSLEVPRSATVADLAAALAAAVPALNQLLKHCVWAVDAEYANGRTPITMKSDVALIPPVSGG